MIGKFKELYAVSPWWGKLLLVVVLPLVLFVFAGQKIANLIETYNRGLFQRGRERAEQKQQELEQEAARTEGKLDAIEEEKQRQKDKVDTEDGDDLSDWLGDR